jgi:hypothetical protein
MDRWRIKMEAGAKVVEHLHDERGSKGQVWVGMFAFSDAKKDDDMSQMHIDLAAAGATKDCDNDIQLAAPITPARTLIAARDFKKNCCYCCSCGHSSICCKGEGYQGKTGYGHHYPSPQQTI